MPTKLADNKLGYAGFLEGYKAQNIESRKVSLEFHWEQIEESLTKMSQDAFGVEVDGRVMRILAYVKSPSEDMIERSIYFGEHIKTLVTFICRDRKDVLKDSNFRSAFYHYINIAEMIVDSRVVKIAVEIGEKLQE